MCLLWPFVFVSNWGFFPSMKYCVFWFWCYSKTQINRICWGLLGLHLFLPWIGNTADDSEQTYPAYYSHAQNHGNIGLKRQKHFSSKQLSSVFARLCICLTDLSKSFHFSLRISKMCWVIFFSVCLGRGAWGVGGVVFWVFFLEISIVHSPGARQIHIQSRITDNI